MTGRIVSWTGVIRSVVLLSLVVFWSHFQDLGGVSKRRKSGLWSSKGLGVLQTSEAARPVIKTLEGGVKASIRLLPGALPSSSVCLHSRLTMNESKSLPMLTVQFAFCRTSTHTFEYSRGRETSRKLIHFKYPEALTLFSSIVQF